MVKTKKVYSCYYCCQPIAKSQLILVNVADQKDEFRFVSKEQKELICRPC